MNKVEVEGINIVIWSSQNRKKTSILILKEELFIIYSIIFSPIAEILGLLLDKLTACSVIQVGKSPKKLVLLIWKFSVRETFRCSSKWLVLSPLKKEIEKFRLFTHNSGMEKIKLSLSL